jgi:hypothetical protein
MKNNWSSIVFFLQARDAVRQKKVLFQPLYMGYAEKVDIFNGFHSADHGATRACPIICVNDKILFERNPFIFKLNGKLVAD